MYFPNSEGPFLVNTIFTSGLSCMSFTVLFKIKMSRTMAFSVRCAAKLVGVHMSGLVHVCKYINCPTTDR